MVGASSSSTFDIQAEQDRISSTKDVINTPTSNKSSSSPSSKKFPLKNLRKGKKDTNSAATAEKPMSISVNGKPLLEIHPTASVEDVQSFLNNVQTGIEAKTDAQEVTADDESVECSLNEEEEELAAAAAEKVKGKKKKKKSSKKLSLRQLQSAAKSMTSKSMKKVQKKSVKIATESSESKKDATATATTTTGEEEEAAITNIGMVDSNAHKDVDVLDNDDDDETESIEAVEHEGFVHIGFLTPMEEDDDATANDGSCNGYTPYHLQLMIDGVVVQVRDMCVVVFGNILLYLCILNHNILSLTKYAYILLTL